VKSSSYPLHRIPFFYAKSLRKYTGRRMDDLLRPTASHAPC
jgi:hypothetical protein